MKQRCKAYTLLLFLLGIGFGASSQNYTAVGQYMYHQALFNPAAMGSYQEIRGALLLRQQWVGVDGAPRLYALNVSIPYKEMGVGFSVYQSEIGVQKETRLVGSYSYRLTVSKDHYLSFGIGAGASMLSRDYASVVTSEENDHLFSSDVKSKITPDFQLGAYYFSKKFYAGVSIPSILKSDVRIENGEAKTRTNFDKNVLHVFLQGGYEESLSEDFRLNVSTMVKYLANVPVEFDLNAMLSWQDHIGLGVSYRTSNEILGLLNLRLSDKIRLGYAYQYSTVVKQHFNTHEILLLYSLNKKNRRRIKMQSPRF